MPPGEEETPTIENAPAPEPAQEPAELTFENDMLPSDRIAAEENAAPVAPEPVVEEPTPALPVVEPPVAAAPVVAAPAATPPSPNFDPPPQPQQPQPPTPEVRQKQRNDALTALTDAYAKQIPKDLLAEILTNPEAAQQKLQSTLATLAAKGQMASYEAAYATVMQNLPRVLQRHTQAQVQSQSQQERFLTKWPQLNDTKYFPHLASLTKTFQQLFPQASMDQAIDWVGRKAIDLLEIKGQAAPAPKASPTAPANPATMQIQPPFSPPRGGPSAAPPTKPTENFWGVFSQEIEKAQE